jgi:hypothetical protein
MNVLDQIAYDLKQLLGALIGIGLVLIAIGIWGSVNRAKIRIKLNRAGWIGLGVFTVGLTLYGYVTSLI